MYALIVKSNSGQSYVYGLFKTKEEGEKYCREHIPARGMESWQVVTFLPVIMEP